MARATSTTIARELEELGYAVAVEFDTDPPARLVVTHEKWGPAHRVDVDVRPGEVDARFVTDATVGPVGRVDVHRRNWAAGVDAVRQKAADHGVTSEWLWTTDDPRPTAAPDVPAPRRRPRPQVQERSPEE